MIYNEMKSGERAACAKLAAEAFYDYEYFAYYIPELRKRKKFLDSLLASEFKSCRERATFLTAEEDDRICAVTMLCPPGYRKPSDGEYLKNGFMKCYLAGGLGPVSRWNDMEKIASAPCHELKNAWYISLLTVNTECQGKMVGSRMLKESIIPYVEGKGGNELCLFTNSEINRDFYEKNGFELFHEQFFDVNGNRLGSWSYRMDL